MLNPSEIPPEAEPWIVWTYGDATGRACEVSVPSSTDNNKFISQNELSFTKLIHQQLSVMNKPTIMMDISHTGFSMHIVVTFHFTPSHEISEAVLKSIKNHVDGKRGLRFWTQRYVSSACSQPQPLTRSSHSCTEETKTVVLQKRSPTGS